MVSGKIGISMMLEFKLEDAGLSNWDHPIRQNNN